MIVFYMPDLRAGGAERVILNLLTYFSRQNLLQLVLLLGKKEGKLLEQLPTNVPVYCLNAFSAKSAVIPLIRFCRKYHPSVILGTLGAGLALALAKPFIPKPCKIINRLGNTIGAEKLLLNTDLHKKYYIFLNKLTGRLSTQMIFQCQYMAMDYINETKIKQLNYKVIYNPVDIGKITDLAKETIMEKYDFVAVGRLDVPKDYFTLINAANLLKQRTCNFTLAILGDGKQKDVLFEEIKKYNLQKNVFLLGYVKNPYSYMYQAKYLLSSSIYEGFSNVIVESLCLGTPVIASDCPGGNRETINDRNGILFPVGDSLQMANRMEYGLNNCSFYDRNAIALNAKDKYAIEIIAQQYLEILNK